MADQSTPAPWVYEHIDECPSTNDLVRQMLSEKTLSEWFALSTSRQTQGKGRENRSWLAPEGNVSITACVQTDFFKDKSFQLPLVVGCTLFQVVKSICNLEPKVKWPNDILISNRKVAGILCEMIPDKNRALLGIGINLNSTSEQFPSELKEQSTTLRDQTGARLDKQAFINEFLRRLHQNLNSFALFGYDFFAPILEHHLAFKGQPVNIIDHGQISLMGELVGLDRQGFLVIKDSDCHSHTIMAGDLNLRRA